MGMFRVGYSAKHIKIRKKKFILKYPILLVVGRHYNNYYSRELLDVFTKSSMLSFYGARAGIGPLYKFNISKQGISAFRIEFGRAWCTAKSLRRFNSYKHHGKAHERIQNKDGSITIKVKNYDRS